MESKTISDLKSFTIRGLFGYKDIVLPLDKEVLILIAENGAGKTNILNILYQILALKFGKLKFWHFTSISINLFNHDPIQINFNQSNKISQETEKKVLQSIENDVDDNVDSIWAVAALGFLQEFAETKKNKNKPKNQYEKIVQEIKKININSNILYFPTYRRIEEDLSNLGYENVELKDDDTTTLIQFGMEDVKNKFKQIQTEIKNTAFELFSRVTGEMLTQFIEGLNVTPEMRESINIDILNLILSRVGENNIDKSEQEKIKKLVTSGEINNSNYDDLVYFLSKLIDLYKDQRTIDETIKSFVNVCNKYLKPNKEIIYNESTAEIYIQQTRNNQMIELNNLSSGEKQIISLFYQVYLEAEDDFILIIDEPELSISVEWQRMLLPDIMRSGKCKRLIAATHSPFIFDNELGCYVHTLDEFVPEN